MRHFALGIARTATFGFVLVLVLASASMARIWQGANDGLKINAELEAYDGKTAWLKIGGTTVIEVPLEKLSDADQEYLRKTYPNGKEGDTKPKKEGDGDKPAPDKPAAEKPASDEPAPAEPADDKPLAKVARSTRPPGAKALAARAGAAKAGEVNVEVVSLTVTKKLPEGSGATGLVPGTHATVLVLCPSKTLLRLDGEKTKIACADDRATKLSKPPAAKPPADGEATEVEGGLTMEVAPDGHSGTVVFDYPQTPNPKATRLRLKGELHVVCGTEESPENVTVPVELIVSIGL